MGIDVPQVRAFNSHDWPGTTRLAESDQQAPLDPKDLERWAVAAHLVGEDDQVISFETAPTAPTSTVARLGRQRAAYSGSDYLDNAGRAARRLAGETSAHPG